MPSVVTIGVFDGVHLGHRQLIGCAVDRAQALGRRPLALTFDPHPREVLGKPGPVGYLTDLDERISLIRRLGVSAVAVLHFSREVAALGAEEFVRELVGRLGMSELWVGPEFALGHRREGTVPVLRTLGSRLGFRVHTVSHVLLDGVAVSSSAIRAHLTRGEVEAASELLGRPYALHGIVQVGEQRGRTLGFPTANLPVDTRRVLPADGVYVVVAETAAGRSEAVASIGVRPTFGVNQRNLEVHLLSEARELYGQSMRVEFLTRLRPERRFESVEALVAQMREDVAAARRYFAKRGPLSTEPFTRAEEP